MNELSQASYEELIDELDKLHIEDPEETEDALRDTIIDLRISKTKDNTLDNIKDKKDVIAIYVLCIIILLAGLLKINGLYYFGFIFFIAGYCVAAFPKDKGTLVFLFSHGITGLCLMVVPILIKVFDNPIMTDNPTRVLIYIGFIILLLLVATSLMLFYKLFDQFDKKEHSRVIPLVLYTIGIVMTKILSIIIV